MIEPGSAQWQRVITPSKVPAILGVSKFDSPFRCWHRMAGNLEPEPDNQRFRLGHALEHALHYMWLDENPGWQLSPDGVQIIGDSTRFGFDYICTLDRRARRGSSRRVVQFKTVRDLDDWGEWDTDEAPAYVVAQVITEMAFSGYTAQPASVAVLGPFYEPRFYSIPWSASTWSKLLPHLQNWHVSLQTGEPPELDDSFATYDCLRELHPDIEESGEGAEVQIEPSHAELIRTAHANHKLAEQQLTGEKSKLLELMGRAKYAKVGDDVVGRRQRSNRNSVSLTILKPKTEGTS